MEREEYTSGSSRLHRHKIEPTSKTTTFAPDVYTNSRLLTPSVSKKELVEYIELHKPDYVGYGDHPRYRTTSSAFHLFRIGSIHDKMPLYSSVTTSLVPSPIIDIRKGKENGLTYNGLSGDLGQVRDVGGALVLNTYRSSMILDPDTLVNIFRHRMNRNMEAETDSYAYFEKWTAAILEMNQPSVYAFYVGILSSPKKAIELQTICVTEKKSRIIGASCADRFIDHLAIVFKRHWYLPSYGDISSKN
jgi:hypothetical protein